MGPLSPLFGLFRRLTKTTHQHPLCVQYMGRNLIWVSTPSRLLPSNGSPPLSSRTGTSHPSTEDPSFPHRPYPWKSPSSPPPLYLVVWWNKKVSFRSPSIGPEFVYRTKVGGTPSPTLYTLSSGEPSLPSDGTSVSGPLTESSGRTLPGFLRVLLHPCSRTLVLCKSKCLRHLFRVSLSIVFSLEKIQISFFLLFSRHLVFRDCSMGPLCVNVSLVGHVPRVVSVTHTETTRSPVFLGRADP